MKKFVITITILILFFFTFSFFYYESDLVLNSQAQPEKIIAKSENKKIQITGQETAEGFFVKGVSAGAGLPGYYGYDFPIEKETYLRWFSMMQAMGANTVKLDSLHGPEFYDALKEYNSEAETPLYLLQGITFNSYLHNSRRDAFHKDVLEDVRDACRTTVDVIHGRKRLALRKGHIGSGSYTSDVSEWTIGFILGSQFPTEFISYTDHTYSIDAEKNTYKGTFLETTSDSSPFESFLAMAGDFLITYENNKYKMQTMTGFSCYPLTDPFEYSSEISSFYGKSAATDIEHIRPTSLYHAGLFAPYTAYPGDEIISEDNLSYEGYLKKLNDHHSIPVVISEFGVSDSRCLHTADQQAELIGNAVDDIQSSGISGGCVVWQDQWFKHTWNTMYSSNLHGTPYWHDVQSINSNYGIMGFIPDEKETLATHEDLTLQCDQSFLYFCVNRKGFNIERDRLYIPIDITPESGSYSAPEFNLKFNRPCDFLIVIDGKKNSRLMVQERYDSFRSTYAEEALGFNTYLKENIPSETSSVFGPVNICLNKRFDQSSVTDTGRLTYGKDADFYMENDQLLIKIPWQLLNFADPSSKLIHSDYYNHNYGVDYTRINHIYADVCYGTSRASLIPYKLKSWKKRFSYEEKLKPAYYVIKEKWGEKV